MSSTVALGDEPSTFDSATPSPAREARSDTPFGACEAKRVAGLQRHHRARELLRAVNLTQRSQLIALKALADDQAPHPDPQLAALGRKQADGMTVRQLASLISAKCGAGRDRETIRDYVLAPLLAVGVIKRVTLRRLREQRPGRPAADDGHLRAKSPRCAYKIDPEVMRLLRCAERTWPRRLSAWVADADLRCQKNIEAQASAQLAHGRSTHGTLIRAAVTALRSGRYRDFELVFTDDADGDRIQPQWQPLLDAYGLQFGLGDRYPDAVLARRATDGQPPQLVLVDAVISDGEVDELRAADLRAWAQRMGYEIADMITAYADHDTYRRRQATMHNLAVGSACWIAEDGGHLHRIESLA